MDGISGIIHSAEDYSALCWVVLHLPRRGLFLTLGNPLWQHFSVPTSFVMLLELTITIFRIKPGEADASNRI